MAPVKTTAILDAKETNAIEPAVLDESSLLLAMRQNIIAGKAVAYTSEAIKKYDDVEIKVSFKLINSVDFLRSDFFDVDLLLLIA